MRKTPAFWYGSAAPPPALKPLAWLYDRLSRLRRGMASPHRAGVPVICIGNITMGGSGKTPAAIAVARILYDLGFLPHFLTRGYGGRLKGPVLVKAAQHGFQDTGDEPLLLARHAPCWVARKRAAGAVAAEEGGAGALVMDDGFQNPSLHKTLSFPVIDAAAAFGNGAVFPAGPLREQPENALKRADACIILGAKDDAARRQWQERLKQYGFENPVFFATLKPQNPSLNGAFVAFAGIGLPQKFRSTLEECGAKVKEFFPFPDHYAYKREDIKKLLAAVRSHNAALITTEKDAVRLPPNIRETVRTLPVALQWQDEQAITAFLKSKLQQKHDV